jgi:NADPH-dependent glutamate synthase beta subunit-like oxidoreductase
MTKLILALVYRCLHCHSCEIACAREHNGPPRISVTPVDERYSVPVSCRLCPDAPCITICHPKAIIRDEKGILDVNKLCDSCKFCIMACPFRLPKINPVTHIAAICDLCPTRLEEGKAPACVSTCPAGALVYDEIDSATERAITARCTATCPAGINVPRYVRATGQGKYDEALAVIREANPLPSICGRVCFAPCENTCRQGKQNEPISIRMLKRFVTDKETEPLPEKVNVSPTGKRVAIIGSGPAGLTAAYFIAKIGHQVTIFEALPQPGGMMRVGIPEYRLPKDVLDRDIKPIVELGVEIRVNTKIESLDQLFEQGYNAILVAVGAHRGIRVGVEGENNPRVVDCVTLLRDISLGKSANLGDKVIVIGGGNAAIDASRTALRLGSKEVIIAYRRTGSEMPASAAEVEAALEEGIKIDYLVAPTKIMADDSKVRVELTRMKLGAPDISGRPRPEPIPGSEFTMDADFIIAAIGQSPDIPKTFGLTIKRGNILEIDDSLATSREGVFAAGDAVLGPASVIEAIAQGKKAAISIDKYLGGSGILQTEKAPPENFIALTDLVERLKERQRPATLCISMDVRNNSFSEVELGLSEEMATEEGKRCLRCDLEQ